MRNWLGLWAVVGVLAVGCGGGTSSGNTPPPPKNPVAPTQDGGTQSVTITISGFNFSPAELTVDAGTQITVKNSDTSSPHSVTSEAKDNDYVKGSVAGVTFDTGALSPAGSGGTGPYGPTPGGPGGTAVITIPAGTPSGTVIPFFCTVHTSMMNPPNGHITVR